MVAHLFLAASLGFGPVILFLAGLVYLDSFKLVGIVELLGLIGLGVLAAGISYPLSGVLMDALRVDFSTYSHYVAPLLEEALKAAMMIWLFSRSRIGFMVDAAILGAAIGSGFALAENAYYFYVFPEANIATWVIRGLGTAVMHSGSTAIFAIVTEALWERNKGLGIGTVFPGFLFAVSLHAIFNQFIDYPFVSTAGILVVLPLMLMVAVDKSEHEVHDWLIHDYDTHKQLLDDIRNGEFTHSAAGEFITSLAARFSDETVAEIFAYLKLHTQLVLDAEKLILAHEKGEMGSVDRADAAMFTQLHALERKIGRTALATVWPYLKFSRQELFELHFLEHESRHSTV